MGKISDVLAKFRSKDDKALGGHAAEAAKHRKALEKETAREKKRQEKQRIKDEKKRAKEEKKKAKELEKAKKAVAKKTGKKVKDVTPEDLYGEVPEEVKDEVYEDEDMPSSSIKGKIFKNYKPLGSAPKPHGDEEAPHVEAPRKKDIKELSKLFDSKFKVEKKKEEPKKEKKSSKKEKKKVKEVKKVSKHTGRKKVTKKLIRKTPSKLKAPPIPPAEKVDPRYVKEHEREKTKEQRKEEVHAGQEEKKQAEANAEQQAAVPVKKSKKEHLKTGFWIALGIVGFMVLLAIIFIVAVLAIDFFTGVPVMQNGTLVLP